MASTIFNLGGVKLLKSKLRFNISDVQIITGLAADPTITPVDAVAGSIYIRSTGEVYIKNTSGLNVDFRTVTSQAALDAHINAVTDAHDASAISSIAAGNLASTNVQGALNELQSDIDTRSLDSQVIKKDGSVAFTGNQSMGGFKLTSLAAGTVASDGINKGQFDAMLEGLKPKTAVRVSTTANITIATALNAGDVIDGVTLANGDRVLVKDQTAAESNGIYVVSATPTRSTDFDSLSPIDEINGSIVAVQEGTSNAGKIYVQSGTVSVLETDPINFVFFNSSSSLTGGDGVTVSGSNISVDHDGEGLQFVAAQLALELDGTTLTKSATGLKVSDATLNTKANIALDNLTATSINQSLEPNTNATRDLGGTNKWRKLFVATIDNATGPIIDTSAQALTDAGALIATWSSSGLSLRPSKQLIFKTPDNITSVALIAPPNGTPSVTYTLPAEGTSGQLLQTNGAGILSFVSPAAGYTDEQAQDAVGTILVDSSKIDFTYNDATPSITATIVAGSLVDADINASAAINATKIADGSVNNNEYQRLAGVTSNIQTQFTGKLNTTMNNLGTTAFNATINPDSHNVRSIGASTLKINTIWVGTAVKSDSYDIVAGTSNNATIKGALTYIAAAPDTIAIDAVLQNAANGRSGVITHDDAVANTSATGNIFIGSGNKSAGTGNSGSVIVRTGTSSGGTRGTVNLVDASLAGASVGHVWTLTSTSTGAGNWAASAVSSAPTIQKFTTGSGTYTTPANVKYIQVELVGGGAGGGGTGGAGVSAGGIGGNTTFGSTVVVGNGGLGGGSEAGVTGGAGGTSSLSGSSGLNVDGGDGMSGNTAITAFSVIGGGGGGSALGGAGHSNPSSGAGADARTNSGSGGGGAISRSGNNAAGGGGAGGYARALVFTPAATYAYAIGAPGNAGIAGTGGFAGGAGGRGLIVVTEYY